MLFRSNARNNGLSLLQLIARANVCLGFFVWTKEKNPCVADA